MIRRLLYVSTILAPHLPSAVEDILRASVANNLRDGLTGFLICDGVHFIQALEGEPAAVEACLGRIAADDRHTALAVRLDGLAEARRFDRWSMCALYLSEMDDALLAPRDIEFDLERASADALWRHLAGLADRHAEALDAEHARLLAALDEETAM
jgi:hypothetical protein